MAHFRAIIQGNGGETSRLGTAASGICAHTCSWQGKVTVELAHGDDGQDWAHVWLRPHNGAGISRLLYSGPVSGAPASPQGEV